MRLEPSGGCNRSQIRLMAQIVQLCVLIVVPIETYKQSFYVKQTKILSREPLKI